MGARYATGKYAWGECDICGVAFKLHTLKRLTINLSRTNLFACPDCWNPDHPQYWVGRKPVVDPQALRDARPDTGAVPSRDFQWGWAPVGLGNELELAGLVSNLQATGEVGTVTVSS